MRGGGEGRRQPPAADASPPIDQAADPRWVLAVRASEQLQGTVLSPERREKLLRVGAMLGLSTFDSNLIIAIVQDQARRGHSPEQCPTAGEAQLRMVPLARRGAGRLVLPRGRRLWTTAWLIAGLLAGELLLLMWLAG